MRSFSAGSLVQIAKCSGVDPTETTVAQPASAEKIFDPEMPRMMPATPPMRESVSASMMNCSRMSQVLAPTDMRIPISRVRSVTETSMMFMMPTSETQRPVTDVGSKVEGSGQRSQHHHRGGLKCRFTPIQKPDRSLPESWNGRIRGQGLHSPERRPNFHVGSGATSFLAFGHSFYQGRHLNRGDRKHRPKR